MNFILTAVDGDASEIVMEINNYKEIKLPVVLNKGQSIKYTGGNRAAVYDANWQLIREIDIIPADFKINKGENSVSFDCRFSKEDKNPNIKLEFRTSGNGERITLVK